MTKRMKQPRKIRKPLEKKESDFTPKPGRNKWLDMYIDEVNDEVIKGVRQKVKSNLTKAE